MLLSCNFLVWYLWWLVVLCVLDVGMWVILWFFCLCCVLLMLFLWFFVCLVMWVYLLLLFYNLFLFYVVIVCDFVDWVFKFGVELLDWCWLIVSCVMSWVVCVELWVVVCLFFWNYDEKVEICLKGVSIGEWLVSKIFLFF